VRALVTADLVHELPVSGSLKQRGLALDWFRASIAYLKPEPPMLVCVGGLSGTGKTTVSAELAPYVGAAPGALHVRSDVERKVLAGVNEGVRLPDEAYSRTPPALVYDACYDRTKAALMAGHSVVLDAVFADSRERDAAAAIAGGAGAAFRGVWLEGPPEILKARVTGRKGDASDATAAVVGKQLAYDVGSLTWQRIDASGARNATLERVRETLASRPAVPA
jgi:predicted kinase